MIRKGLIICMLFALGTTAAIAQKFGHIDSQTLLQEMPAALEANTKIQQETTALEEEITKMRAEYDAKVKAFEGLLDTTPEAVRKNRYNEIALLEQNIQQFAVSADQNLNTRQQELYAPIIEEVKLAIEAVGKENGFTYIFDSSLGVLVYEGGENVAPLVKAKLGIQ